MKKKQYTPKEIEDIIFMVEWSNFICLYYAENGDEIFFDWVIKPEFEYHKDYLAGLRESFNDMNDSAFDIPNEEFTELNRRLKERFGKTLYDFQKNTDKKIAQIIKRKKIRNEEEFRLAQMHIDRIFQDTEKEEEWKILEDLCFDFEQSVEVS
jgi:hypothetical protein